MAALVVVFLIDVMSLKHLLPSTVWPATPATQRADDIFKRVDDAINEQDMRNVQTMIRN
jgi:hypothetical protein